ncbi:uncharacterized protein STEHIDRAFT_62067 [Stereum hirsutum FP-91666 SS1]|uniref:uncharacterized protein n=1 Tax=Stereum hirsutum (strain FP-91666) TaxID=721885 RepID=UPI000444A716|nr:uncharacterized protein STEHIDRAFT_62067 [Stereum hirsutum FP-91666 SS1]EIM83911.1 hypothetical protein STEHIDRAFT_62067 [Stereum hirsutum FP-91666 SS1]
MDATRGIGRGSYIWGRSVHNTRSERLWYDVTTGFGAKWKKFFLELEHLIEHALDPERAAHIWLLHHLFLASINADATDWVATWNSHPITGRGVQRQASPQEMYLMGMAELGARGLDYITADDQVVTEDPTGYGIDWEVHGNPTLLAHHLENNPQEWESENPFASAGSPDRLSDVPCEPPNCPFTPQEVAILDRELYAEFGTSLASRDMIVRKAVWIHAVMSCETMYRSLYTDVSAFQ